MASEDLLLLESNWDLKKQFADFLRKRLQVPDGLSVSKAEKFRKTNKPLVSLQALALDPESVIEGLGIDAMRNWLAD